MWIDDIELGRLVLVYGEYATWKHGRCLLPGTYGTTVHDTCTFFLTHVYIDPRPTYLLL